MLDTNGLSIIANQLYLRNVSVDNLWKLRPVILSLEL